MVRFVELSRIKNTSIPEEFYPFISQIIEFLQLTSSYKSRSLDEFSERNQVSSHLHGENHTNREGILLGKEKSGKTLKERRFLTIIRSPTIFPDKIGASRQCHQHFLRAYSFI